MRLRAILEYKLFPAPQTTSFIYAPHSRYRLTTRQLLFWIPMSEFSTLKRHSTHYLTGRIGMLLLGFVSFPLFTRLFSVSAYGEMNLVFKVILCFVVLAKLGIQNSVVRFYEERVGKGDGTSTREYYSTLLFGAGGLGTLVVLLFVFGLWCLPQPVVTTSARNLLTIASLLIPIRAEWSILSGFLQAEGRTKLYNALDIGIKAFSIVVICILLFAWQRSLTAFFIGTVAVEAAAVLLVAGILARRRLLHWTDCHLGFLKTVLAFGFPLVAYEIASVILDSGDRFLIQRYLGGEQLGYYSAAYNLSAYAQISLMAPVNLAIIPIYMKLWVNEGEEKTKMFLARSLDIFLMAAVGMCSVVSLISHDLVVFLASKKFEPSYRILPILIVGLFIYSVHIFLTPGLLIYKKTFLMARQVIYATVFNVALNVLLLPRIGIAGAAWATLLSYLFLIALIAHASFPLLAVPIDYKACAGYLLAAGITYCLVAQIHLHPPLLGLIGKTAIGTVLYLGLLAGIDPKVRKVLQTRFQLKKEAVLAPVAANGSSDASNTTGWRE